MTIYLIGGLIVIFAVCLLYLTYSDVSPKELKPRSESGFLPEMSAKTHKELWDEIGSRAKDKHQ